MAAFSAMAAIGVATQVAGLGLQFAGQQQAAKESKRQAAITKSQMNLEANRQRRQIIRQAMIARSEAVSSATAQGAAQGSGLAGGLGQITNEAGAGISNTNLGQQLGTQMYRSQVRQADAGTLSAMGSGLSSLGGAFVNNAEAFNRLATYNSQPA